MSMAKLNGKRTKRVFVVYPANQYVLPHQRINMNKIIGEHFNGLRNYREFSTVTTVEVVEAFSNQLPKISEFNKNEDALLIVGTGRILDQTTYNFSKHCLEASIPVYYVRGEDWKSDPRLSEADKYFWENPEILVKKKYSTHYLPSKFYFMEIPEIKCILKTDAATDEFYALLPTAVAMP